MSKSRPISPKELAALRQSVRLAKIRLFRRMSIFDAAQLAGLPKAKREQEKWLNNFVWEDGRAPWIFNDARFKRVVMRALDEYDLEFFVRLGATLKRKRGFFWMSERISKLEHFLLDHWAKRKDNLPELFRLTAKDLTTVCNRRLKHQLSEDAVVKTRQRLGLKPFKRRKLLLKGKGDKLEFLEPDEQ
jgi:hypothetical protein